MAKKDRTLYVLKYLWKNTDEDHPATVSDILAALENENIKVERHALMSDIEQLTEFGIDIVCVKSSPNRYFIGQRSFELPELKLLVDEVESSRFINKDSPYTKSYTNIRIPEFLIIPDNSRGSVRIPTMKSLN